MIEFIVKLTVMPEEFKRPGFYVLKAFLIKHQFTLALNNLYCLF